MISGLEMVGVEGGTVGVELDGLVTMSTLVAEYFCQVTHHRKHPQLRMPSYHPQHHNRHNQPTHIAHYHQPLKQLITLIL